MRLEYHLKSIIRGRLYLKTFAHDKSNTHLQYVE